MAGPSFSGFVIPGGVAARDLTEIQFDLSGGAAPYSNPFDDQVIAVDAAITDPNGVLRLPPNGSQFTIPCAWIQKTSETGNASGHGETFAALSTGHWYLHFRFDLPGVWTIRFTATDAGGTTTSSVQSITIGPVGSGTAAVLGGHLSPWRIKNGYITLDDGTWLPFYGQNQAVIDRDYTLDGTPGFTKFLGYLGKYGAPVARFMLSSYHRNGLEWSSSAPLYSGFDNLYVGLGRYSQQFARRVDQFLTIAQANGVSVLFALNTHGEFSTSSDAQWSHSPYSDAATPAGPVPASDPALMLTNASAIRYQKLKLRYVIARWAGYPSFGCIEWMNETGSVGNGFFTGNNTVANDAAWVATMQAYKATIDPYDIADSDSEEWDPSAGKELQFPQNSDPIMVLVDLPQEHVYQNDPATTVNDRRHTALDMDRNMQLRLSWPSRVPVWTETGLYRSPSAPEPNFNPVSSSLSGIQKNHLLAGTHVRASLWEGIASGFIGGLEWWFGSLAENAGQNRVSGTLPYGGTPVEPWHVPLATVY